MSIKEQYWKYSLIVIILFMGIIIFRQITPFLGGLLGALTIYILVRTQMTHLTEKWKLKRSVAALLITAETVMVFLVPLGLTIWLLVNQLQDINLDPQTFIAPMQQVAEFIKEKTGYDVLGKDTLSFIVSILPRIGQIIMESISSLAINLFVMVFVLYFMLIGGKSYDRTKGWLHKRVAFDTLFQSLRYLCFALAGKPYMGIGRNMAYRKELFFQRKGYSTYLNLQRGEDDLFINQIATPSNTRVETDINATMRIQPVYSYKEWKEEKISYMATARFYHGVQRYLLGFETFSHLLFYAACIAGLVFGILNNHWLAAGIALLIWLFRYTVQAIIINRTAKEMGGDRKYYFSLPVFDILQPIQSLKFKLYRSLRRKGDFMRR